MVMNYSMLLAPSQSTIWIDHKVFWEEIDDRLVFNSIDSSLIFIKDNICDYDIILIMTNKDSSLIYNPIIKHLEKSNVPIFPLKIVALPGSIQSLQIFEPRYVNMVKNSLKDDSGFVIAFLKKKTQRAALLSLRKVLT